MSYVIVDLTMCFGRGRAAVHGGGEYGKAAAAFLGRALRTRQLIALVREGDADRAAEDVGDHVVIRTVADGPLQRLPADLDEPDNVLFLPLPAHFLEQGERCRARLAAVEHGLRDHEKADGLRDHLCHPLLTGGLARSLLCAYASRLHRKKLGHAQRRYRRRLAPLRPDDILITPSRHSKYALRLAFANDAAGVARGPLERIAVLPPLSPFRRERATQPTNRAGGILLLSVNRPLKNAQRFLEGVSRHPLCRDAANRVGIDLVGSDPSCQRRLERRFAASLRMRFHPYVEENELERLLRQATVLAFPSLSEGYGIPPVAAFAHGTPVIASASTAVSEATGGAAMLADPLQGTEMANRLLEVLEDERQREALANAGLRRYAELEQSALSAWHTFAQMLDSAEPEATASECALPS